MARQVGFKPTVSSRNTLWRRMQSLTLPLTHFLNWLGCGESNSDGLFWRQLHCHYATPLFIGWYSNVLFVYYFIQTFCLFTSHSFTHNIQLSMFCTLFKEEEKSSRIKQKRSSSLSLTGPTTFKFF